MAININLDEKSLDEIDELAGAMKISRSKLIRIAINEFYLKEKRARENLNFFIDMYNKGVIDKNTLFLLLPKEDAEAIVIGTKIGKEAVEIVKELNS